MKTIFKKKNKTGQTNSQTREFACALIIATVAELLGTLGLDILDEYEGGHTTSLYVSIYAVVSKSDMPREKKGGDGGLPKKSNKKYLLHSLFFVKEKNIWEKGSSGGQ